MKAMIAALAALATLGGCTAIGDVRDPAVRRLTWFSYVSGDDMQCETGLDRVRLIHNAIWDEDVRVVEAVETPGSGYRVTELRLRAPNWAAVAIDPAAPELPWRGEQRTGTWGAAEMARLDSALAADGAFAPLARPVELEGQGFFWTGTGCRNGARWFHAWAYPGAAYDALRFPAVLAPLTPSGEAFAPAHPVVQAYPNQNPEAPRDFRMKAEADGVAGRLDLPHPPLGRFLP